MLSKTLMGLTALALAGEATARSLHRHGFQHIHQRAVVTDVEVVTDFITTTVWIGGEPTTTPKTRAFYTASHRRNSKVSSSKAVSTSTPSPTPSPSTPPTTLEATSTSTSAQEPIALAVDPTTLATSTKPSTVESIPSPVAAVSVAAAIPIQIAVGTSSAAAAAATTTAASSSTTDSSKKRGLAYNDPNLLSGFLGSSSKVSWKYNWAQTDDGGSSGIEFVPMLWGLGENHEPTWNTSANKAIAAGSKHFLSFNEPDNSGQANLSPATAAAAHIRLMKQFSDQGIKIGSPAITNSNIAGEGIDWIKSFFTACNGECPVDFVPVHWYNSPDANEFLQHLVNVHDAVNKPIWITEFAPSGSEDQINQFLKTVMAELDSNSAYSFVERYSYFMVGANSLISSGTTLSSFGNTFAYA